MIVFELICDAQHRFEGWFASGDDFASQQRSGLLVCPVCGGVHVEKLPVAKIRKQLAESAQSTPDKAVAVGQGGSADMSRVIDYILTHSEDVGRQFAEEARKIYYAEAPQRNIRGIASRGEADELREEGVPVFSLPVPPQDQWN
jgi:hypothetical protein